MYGCLGDFGEVELLLGKESPWNGSSQMKFYFNNVLNKVLLISCFECCFIFVKPLGLGCEKKSIHLCGEVFNYFKWAMLWKKFEVMEFSSRLKISLHICQGYVLGYFSGKWFHMCWGIYQNNRLNSMIGNQNDLIHDDHRLNVFEQTIDV